MSEEDEIKVLRFICKSRDKTIEAQKEIIKLRDETIKELKLELKAAADFIDVCG